MVSIQIDEQTAKALESAAKAVGVSVNDLLKTLVPSVESISIGNWESLEKELLSLSVDGGIPVDFSRADLYSDHD
jgi:hypothetical protein